MGMIHVMLFICFLWLIGVICWLLSYSGSFRYELTKDDEFKYKKNIEKEQ